MFMYFFVCVCIFVCIVYVFIYIYIYISCRSFRRSVSVNFFLIIDMMFSRYFFLFSAFLVIIIHIHYPGNNVTYSYDRVAQMRFRIFYVRARESTSPSSAPLMWVAFSLGVG